MPAAIIGGTGIYKLEGLSLDEQTIATDYGDVTLMRNDDLVFINRHAPGHSVPPHNVNYRAHIKALQSCGVKRVCGLFAVGLINRDFKLGVPIILSDFIDFTSGRAHTFFDSLDNGVGHVEMSAPFCPVLRRALIEAADHQNLPIKNGGVYAAVNGPRFESPAEINAYRRLGADMVGMTLMPELALARELGMAYSGLAYSINWAACINARIEFSECVDDQTRCKMQATILAALGATTDTDGGCAKLL